MTRGLYRYYGAQDLHFITGSCYHRQPELGTPQRRDLFLQILEQVRKRYGFVVLGYVVMPEHFHLLISEPEKGTPSTVMQVLKQRFSRTVRRRSRHLSLQPTLWTADREPEDIWQKRVMFGQRRILRSDRSCQHPPFANRAKGGAPSFVLDILATKRGPPAQRTIGHCLDGTRTRGKHSSRKQCSPGRIPVRKLS
jgi:REP element-mobilizing transposase RayT